MTPRHGGAASVRSVRPRYGRIVAFTSSLTVTAVALLGATGALSTSSAPQAGASTSASGGSAAGQALALSAFSSPARRQLETEPGAPLVADPPRQEQVTPPDDELPAGSGQGKRVVFDMSAQRVWLVDKDNEVRRTYPVSGSLTDNLKPGTYEVYSTSRHAVGIDDSGTMEYMVRFAHGDRAAIGFHDIPVDDGKLVQSRAELGTPQSHGCIRQARPDARALWYFAILGTTVVVTA